MEKELVCPWCEKKVVPKVVILKKENGDVRERRCGQCNKILAAYLVEERDFMGNALKFGN